LTGESRTISDYVGETRTFVVSAGFTGFPLDGAEFVIESPDRFHAANGLSDQDDYYNGMSVRFTSSATGNILGESREISDYEGAARTFHFGTDFTEPPRDGDAFVIESDDQFDGDATLSDQSGFYNGAQVRFLTGNLTGEEGQVTDYDGGTRTFFFSTAFSEAPQSADGFRIEIEDQGDYSGDFSYTDAQTLTTSRAPSSIVAGDFNSDHITDFAVANSGTENDLGLFLGRGSDGRGDGTFLNPVNVIERLVVSAESSTTFRGDNTLSDQDGIYNGRDVVFASGVLAGERRTISAYAGSTRTFTLSAAVSAAPSVGDKFVIETGPMSFVVTADMNADGVPDLVTTRPDASRVSILLGVGRNGASENGLFDRNTDIAVQNHPFDLMARDFNDDGRTDLGVLLNATVTTPSEGLPAVAIVLQDTGVDGNAEFGPLSLFDLSGDWMTGGTASELRARSFSAGDFTRDGTLDIVVAGSADTDSDFLAVLSGEALMRRPTGRFLADPLQAAANSGGDILSGEFGQKIGERSTEAAQDVIVAGAASTSYGGLFMSYGDVGMPGVLPVDDATGDNPGELSSVNFVAMARGDFDRDGLPDLAAVRTDTNQVEIFLGRRNRTAGQTAFVQTSLVGTGTNPSSVAVGDFNGDHLLDLAVANQDDDTVSILAGDGAGGFTTLGSAISVGGEPVAVVAADLDLDGILDLITANRAAGTVSVLIGQGSGSEGDGSFASAQSYATGDLAAALRQPIAIAVADFNGDGVPDLAIANQGVEASANSRTIRVLLGKEQKTG
jgi:hypothetical protein